VAYATIDDFRDFIGASRLVGMISVDPAEQESFITKLLNAGAASMNSVFAQAGYALPLTPAPAGELADLLTVHNCALAARPLRQGVVDEPVGIRKAIDDAIDWLNRIRSGEEELLGVNKSVAIGAEPRAGRFAFVATGSKNLSRRLFTVLLYGR
jgi:phage gp36-like protein